MLVRAHHHGGILVVVKFTHAQKAFLLDLVFNYVLDLLVHHSLIYQLHL
jgi:hypothetical protein